MDDGPITVYVDGSCPVCSREARFWLSRATPAALRVIDISRPGFDAQRECGVSQLTLMRRIHARLPEGQLAVGVEVFRQVYARLGFARWVAISRMRAVSGLLAVCYEVFSLVRFRRARRCAVALPMRGLSQGTQKA